MHFATPCSSISKSSQRDLGADHSIMSLELSDSMLPAPVKRGIGVNIKEMSSATTTKKLIPVLAHGDIQKLAKNLPADNVILPCIGDDSIALTGKHLICRKPHYTEARNQSFKGLPFFSDDIEVIKALAALPLDAGVAMLVMWRLRKW